MLQQEMNAAYFGRIHRPGEKLGVFDNASDFECCAERTHCNCTHGELTSPVVWDEAQGQYVLEETDLSARLIGFHDVIEGKRHTIMGGGEHNNVYFPGFHQYKARIPEALMQDVDGRFLELRDPDILNGTPIPMPAIDDPKLLRLYARQLARQAALLPGCHYVAAYVMGAEMLYPEYFNLGSGDYRPASWAHFAAWCRRAGEEVPAKRDTLRAGSPARRLWLRYREQAMADRAAYYYQAILSEDDTHLCYYPTHGSMMHGDARARLGQQPDTLAAACDGIEMGHILIDDDAERRNVILTCLNTSYGAPVIVPRLGNKTADLSAAGGGRSFTPQTLRRLVYEDVGMGISIIFPIHWRSHLHDGEWFIKNTPAEAECRRVFDEIIAASPYLTGMGRMQPQVGVLAADDTWLDGYEPRWTALMQDLLSDRANATVVTDALVEAGLAGRMPLLIAVGDKAVSSGTLRRLADYLDNGGRLIVWGEFALDADARCREAVLGHRNCLVSRAAQGAELRTIREMFLAGVKEGTSGTRYRFHAVDYGQLSAEISRFAPDVVLRPFRVSGDAGQVNLYALTDRAAMGCVCVNNGVEEAVLTVAPDERLIGDACAVNMLTGRRMPMPFTLPGHGTALIFFGERPEKLEDAVCRAEDAYERWKQSGADVEALRHYYSGMRTGWHAARRYALARAMLESLALRCRWERSEQGGLNVYADVLDARGERVKDARVWLRITPGTMRRYAFDWDGAQHCLRLPREELPWIYQPDAGDYRPLCGAARLILQAEHPTGLGGCILNISI